LAAVAGESSFNDERISHMSHHRKAPTRLHKGRRGLLAFAVTGVAAALAVTGVGPAISLADPLPVYQDLSRSFEERAADLVSRMTTQEKIAQLVDNAPAIARLGVTGYNYWNEALHGVTSPSGSTMYPSGTGIAATWNRDLTHQIGTGISDEARAQNNVTTGTPKKLTYWSPTLNLARDPRWGRADESYGEDPYLTGQIGAAFVQGLQGDDPTYLKAISTPKHYLANNSESDRRNGNAAVTEREIREYYTPAFAYTLSPEIGARSFMTSYNRVNGVPPSASTYALETLVKRTWGFVGHVTTDCGAIKTIWNRHKWKPAGYTVPATNEEVAAWSVKAGSDIDCQSTTYPLYLPGAYEQGLVTEANLDAEVYNLFASRMRTGEFDPAWKVPYRSSAYTLANQWASDEHFDTSRAVADEAPVLLKNNPIRSGTNGNVLTAQPGLPLTADDAQNLVVVGYMANEFTAGGYSGSNPRDGRSIRTAINQAVQEIAPGAPEPSYYAGVTPSNTVAKPGVQALIFRDAADDSLKEIRADATPDGYPASLTPTPDPDQFVIWEGWQGISYFSGPYFAPSAVWGGYIDAYVDVPTGTSQLCLTQTGTMPTGAFFDVYVGTGQPGETTGGVVASIPADGAAASCTPSNPNGAVPYSGPTGGPLHLIVKWNPGSLGDYGTQGQPGTPWAYGLSAADEAQISAASAVVVVIGTRTGESAEEMDRVNIDFPKFQDELVRRVATLNRHTVVWMQTVGQMDIERFRNTWTTSGPTSTHEVPSIVWSNYNGQSQGAAMADILFGRVNPSGRLPFTWYTRLSELPNLWDYTLAPVDGRSGRTYQYFTGATSYAFGHGLTYSRFAYSNLRLADTTVDGDGTIQASVDVTNTSARTGQEVVQLYVTAPGSDGVERPQRQLRGFAKVELAPGQTDTVTIPVAAKDLWFWDEAAGRATWDVGSWRLQVGPEAGVGPATLFTLTGRPAPALTTVMTVPDGIRLNVNAPDTAIHANLSATDIDQSFLDLGADGVEVVYASSDPAVAAVDQRGTVTPAGVGAATITATVTVGDATKSSSFPVVVQGDDASTVVNLADQVVQLDDAVNLPLAATAALTPPNSTTDLQYLIAPMDENTAGATLTAGGLLTATSPGRVRVTAVATVTDEFSAVTRLVQSAWITVLDNQPPPQITAGGTSSSPGPSGSYTGDVTVAFDVEAGARPVVEVQIDGGAWTLAPGRRVLVTGDGSHTVAARVTDELGRSAETSVTVVIASALPDDGAITAVASPGGLTLTAAPGVSVQYSPDGATWLTYSGPLDIFGWVYYRAVNDVGAGPPGLIWVPQADQTPQIPVTPPTVTVNPPAITVTQPPITVTQPPVTVNPPAVTVTVPPATQPPVVVPTPVVTVVMPTAVPSDGGVTAPPTVPKTLKSARPTVKGKTRVGQKLTAKPGAWTPGVAYTYKWYANGKVIAKATKSTLKLTSKLAGKRIRVKVTGRLAGHQTATRLSAATAKVARR
jgi:beta-glucosidase-like glycosyl hydrolase